MNNTHYRGRRLCMLPALLLAACIPARAEAQAADSLPPLAPLLEQLGEKIELFRQQFQTVACTEAVSQVKFGKKGEVLRRQEMQFDYLILMKLRNNALTVEESRIVKKQSEKGKSAPLLTTDGFPTLTLVFHPIYQNSFEFTRMPEETVGGRKLVRVLYQHIPGTRSTAALRLGERDYPLELRGSAWIDPQTVEIVRITAELPAPLTDLGLQTLTADVQYAPVRFASNEETYMLPSNAAIEVATNRQHWRNTHRFTEYRCFSVSLGTTLKR